MVKKIVVEEQVKAHRQRYGKDKQWKRKNPYTRKKTRYKQSEKDLKQQYAQRSKRARTLDEKKTAKKVYKLEEEILTTNPEFDFRKADVKGIDTAKEQKTNKQTTRPKKNNEVIISFRDEKRVSGSGPIKSKNSSYFIATTPTGEQKPSWKTKPVNIEESEDSWVGTDSRKHIIQYKDFAMPEGTIIYTRNKDYFVVDKQAPKKEIKSGNSTLTFSNDYLEGNLREIDTIMTKEGKYKHLKYIDYDRYKKYQTMSLEEKKKDKQTAIVTEEQFKKLTQRR
ncbi:MAG: hypothetical protein ACTSX6_07565, partial [Candidatus Heimdallarchaeaceae archaeon]